LSLCIFSNNPSPQLYANRKNTNRPRNNHRDVDVGRNKKRVIWKAITDRVRISNKDLRVDGLNTEVSMSLVRGTMKTIGMGGKKEKTATLLVLSKVIRFDDSDGKFFYYSATMT